MFNLGTKQIVLNSSANVKEQPSAGGLPGVITIAGFGSFTIPTPAAAATRGGKVTSAASAVAGVYTITAPSAAPATKSYDLVLGLRSSRMISDIFTDGDVFTFQSVKGAANIGSAFAGGQIAGFNDNILKFSGTSTIIVTFQPGYEGVVIESVALRESAADDVEVPITSAVTTTAPYEGHGLGKHIEEEVQNATFENLDPYGSKGGNETVDVRGKYAEVHWVCVAEDDDSPGWAPHQSLGTGDVNSEAVYGPRAFTAYVNEASGATAIAMLMKLVLGETPTP